MREVSLREFISMWDVREYSIRLVRLQSVKVLDEEGTRFLVRGRFEDLLKELPRAFVGDVKDGVLVLFRGEGDNEELLHLRIKNWEKVRRQYVYFVIEEVWDENLDNAEWIIRGSFRLTKPRG